MMKCGTGIKLKPTAHRGCEEWNDGGGRKHVLVSSKPVYNSGDDDDNFDLPRPRQVDFFPLGRFGLNFFAVPTITLLLRGSGNCAGCIHEVLTSPPSKLRIYRDVIFSCVA